MRLMFKIIKRMAVLSSLLVLSWSCSTLEHNYTSRSSSELIYFAYRLVDYSSETSVSLLTQLASSENMMNESGFTYNTIYSYHYFNYRKLVLDVVWLEDNCWEVSGTDEITNFSLQVVREDSDTLDDEYKWTITSFFLDYGDSNGYYAVMTTEGDIVYDWHVSPRSLTGRVSLLQAGTYYLQTFISGVEADSCTLSYDKGEYEAATNMVS